MMLTRRGLVTGAAALAAYESVRAADAQGIPGMVPGPGLIGGTRAVTTWNPSDAGSGFTFSNFNLTWALSGFSKAVRGTTSKSSGKRYFEVHVDTASTTSVYVGLGYSSASLSASPGGDANGWAFGSNTYFHSGSGTSTGVTYAAGDTLSLAVDFVTPQMWLAVNGVWSGSPSAGTGGRTLGTLSGPLFAMSGVGGNNGSFGATTNFGQSAFTYTPPAGFSAWG